MAQHVCAGRFSGRGNEPADATRRDDPECALNGVLLEGGDQPIDGFEHLSRTMCLRESQYDYASCRAGIEFERVGEVQVAGDEDPAFRGAPLENC